MNVAGVPRTDLNTVKILQTCSNLLIQMQLFGNMCVLGEKKRKWRGMGVIIVDAENDSPYIIFPVHQILKLKNIFFE